MGIPQDIHARLVTALGPDIPVLLPEQQREPLEAAPIDAQGRPMVGGGERGLGAYLRQHPQGYVQIEPPVPLSSDGLVGNLWVTVAAIHGSVGGAAELGQQVYRALCGWPWLPGPYREATPAQPEQLRDGVWMLRRTYAANTLDGIAG